MTKMEKLYHSHRDFNEEEIVLDVRSKEEFAEGHVPGAINIPHEDVGNHIEELKRYKTIHIHCRSGKRAGLAMNTLREAGLTNFNCIDDSGMLHWVEKGFEVEK